MPTRFNHRLLALIAFLGLSAGLSAPLNAADNAIASYIPASDKGGFQYSEPTPYPELNLDLNPIEKQVAEEASTRCATSLAAAPLDLGDAGRTHTLGGVVRGNGTLDLVNSTLVTNTGITSMQPKS